MSMSHLIDKLKTDHSGLVVALEDLKKSGINHPDFKKRLVAVKAGLLAHLKLEDVELYPKLHKAAEKNSSLKSTLNVMAMDMDKVSKAALDFFAKWEKGGGTEMEWTRDCAGLMAALGTRIRREETTLYIEFDKMNNAA
ncbi:MAG: hemerythrin domain-containing protein [Pseudobdellovibrionaceae bacterium]